ncbi:non-hydrolyzing UDP-N-acetylglucosamine 2-epimerase [Uliginosibacterium sp. H1]|uniref:non-hydrolyzing UDP-N-acetylglucosamine 2-epimerase n=1 Tax=Uliginosibacterium sp. H1 TaxID=3114757 RepID=UPI002E19AE1B|nr:UDP-N-acetylglucosamine 2-epimerase (non-hydrolyzing) [Uliginosibacterium sp. H1]
MAKSIYLVAGARPNFMKIAPIVRALQARADAFSYKIVHTGQHYDRDMSDVFFEELGIPQPDHHLECGGGSHAEQTAKIMVAFEQICVTERPDVVLVVGDVNSTLACSIVAKKLHIPVAHVEAGLRSGDMTMPEEINRLVTDSITDWFFCTEPAGVDNLVREGKSKDAIFHVGHVMVDNLFYQADQLQRADRAGFVSEPLKQQLGRYGVVTLHRPSNVDDEATLRGLAGALRTIAQDMPLVFPVHPRTRGNLERFGLDLGANIHLTRPLSYMDFLNLWKDAALILTDSGGLQEETTAMGIPCLTLRENTERPVTLDEGTNTLVGTDPHAILQEAARVIAGQGKQGRRPELWDGAAATRIVAQLEKQIL